MKKPKKQNPVERLFNQHFNGVPVNIMDTPQISKDIAEIVKTSTDSVEIVSKMLDLVEKWKVK